MTQNVQDLINKIKKEGLEASQQKTQELETEAKKQADAIIAEAKIEAQKIIDNAKVEQKKLEESTKASLQQAARDTVLTLKQKINAMLTAIIKANVGKVLDKEQMVKLILTLVKDFTAQSKEDVSVEVELSEEHRALLEKDLLAKLQKELKGGFDIETADDLTGGFTISFDGGKSCFDFSEEALVAYLSKYVNEYVAGLLKDKG